ncbi:hypothetical protein [Patulibacter defluvii]|uniref:hypothetical protein n=1 Tax=Patulibacter defluvii TaxID=3095358 RepID=UPI002A74E130|nr:hypothetical protein [Patulibacter sp. DM4]
MLALRSRRGRVALAATAALAALPATALTVPAVSQARCIDDNGTPCPPPNTIPGKVKVAKGWTLGVRATPRAGAKQIRQVRNGSYVRIICQKRTRSWVSGTYGRSNIWNKIIGGGWVSDAYVHTGTDGFATHRCA